MAGSEDVTVNLIRSLVRAINEPSLATEMGGRVDDWEALAIVMEFADGYRSASGYAYPADGTVFRLTADAARWTKITTSVNTRSGD